SADDVATEPALRHQRLFEVYVVAALPVLQRRARERFARHVGLETFLRDVQRREAYAAHGDAVASGNVAEIEIGAFDTDTPVTAAVADAVDRASRCDDAGKHGYSSAPIL